jgi:hypothetical protein
MPLARPLARIDPPYRAIAPLSPGGLKPKALSAGSVVAMVVTAPLESPSALRESATALVRRVPGHPLAMLWEARGSGADLAVARMLSSLGVDAVVRPGDDLEASLRAQLTDTFLIGDLVAAG